MSVGHWLFQLAPTGARELKTTVIFYKNFSKISESIHEA